MHAIFQRELAKVREETPPHDAARVQTADILEDFPRRIPEHVSDLALQEYHGHWYSVPGQSPRTTAQEIGWMIWFTDAPGYSRLRERALDSLSFLEW
jgi:hypothetical protein